MKIFHPFKKKMLVVDDEEDFQAMLRSIFRKKFDVVACYNSDEFLKKFVNYFWSVIIVDVDLPDSSQPGHVIVRHTMELRNVFPRTIIISNKKGVNLRRIEDEHKTFFQAYIWKEDPEFRGKIVTEVEEAVSRGDNELNILEEKFKEEDMIEDPILESNVTELEGFGSFEVGFSEKETIRSLIESCRSDGEDEEKIKSIMKLLRRILKEHNLAKYEGTK